MVIFILVVSCDMLAAETVKDVKAKLFQFLTAKDPSLASKKIDEYCLKVHGKDEFFHSMDHLLINFDYVRKCVCHNRVLEFSLVDINASFLKGNIFFETFLNMIRVCKSGSFWRWSYSSWPDTSSSKWRLGFGRS